MISQKARGRARPLKMTKNVERLYKEGKCRDCTVVVTRMDFAKILGKFTKVKIQYESNSTPKTKKSDDTIVNSTNRLKKNENGMVLIHRNAHNQHATNESQNSKKPKKNNKQPLRTASPRQNNNILKENNRLKKTPIVKDKNSNYNQKNQHLINSNLKRYGIIFINPSVNNKNDIRSKAVLLDLLPNINKSILPTEEWAIDYFPKSEEPKEDKVYDRIAAELEDLMYNEKPSSTGDKIEATVSKVDDFPSIMDILNDSTPDSVEKPNDQSSAVVSKSDLESCDVEAMLLGKSNSESKAPQSISMDVDGMASLIGGSMDAIQDTNKCSDIESKQDNSEKSCIENVGSPSVLDEALQKGIEEQLPFHNQEKECLVTETKLVNETDKIENVVPMDTDVHTEEESKNACVSDSVVPKTEVTHVIFKQTKDGKCYRCVTCPRNLKYSIELDGKAVEFIGAPKFISSLDDLEILLQIVNETHLESLYVLH